MNSTNSKNFYVTTPIYYANGKPHLGNFYTTIIGDTLKRYYSQNGYKCVFLTGTDEHGEKIAEKATELGITSQQLVDDNAKVFQKCWDNIGLNYDVFYRTTQASHYSMVQNSLQRLFKQGDIKFSSYEGVYCTGCESFLTESDLNDEGECVYHLKKPQKRQESNYFFNLDSHRKKLIDHIKSNPGFIQPSGYANEVLSLLSKPLPDMCISRPKERLTWGIPIPFDENYVTYVWFDALLNYLGGLGYKGQDPKNWQNEFWAGKSVHLLGKDILKTHAVYWPIMLMAMGIPLFKHLYVGGFWTVENQKMSKSLGNIVDPDDLVNEFGIDSVRYYLLREPSFGSDASYSKDSFIKRINSELANGIGNLASRTLTLFHKNLSLSIPLVNFQDQDKELIYKVHEMVDSFAGYISKVEFHKAIEEFQKAVSLCDQYVNTQQPWKLAKDPDQKDRLATVLVAVVNCLWTFAVVSNSILPSGSVKLAKSLGLNSEDLTWQRAKDYLPENHQLGDIPKLYPRIVV